MPPRLDATAADGAQIHSLAAEILARPEYAKFRSDSGADWERLIEQLVDWLARLQSLHHEAPSLYWLVLVMLGLTLLLLIAHITWSLSVALRSAPPPQQQPAGAREPEFARLAAELAARSEHLQAAHQLLLASLAHAARARLLELRPEDSNSRVCAKLRASPLAPALCARLIALIERTDAAWFGARGEGRLLYEQWQALYAELRSAT